MASTFPTSPRAGIEADTDERDIYEFNDDADIDELLSDEDTDDASETELVKKEEEYTEIKEQMYQDKLAQFKKQLQQLKEGTLPEYMKKIKKIEQNFRERKRLNEIWLAYEMENVETQYKKEKLQTSKDFEVKNVDLKDYLLWEFEEKRKQIQGERHTLDLNGDSMDIKTMSTRKLRRRPNDPMPIPEKRRKASPAQLNYGLSEDEINADLKILNKVSGKPIAKKPQAIQTVNHNDADNPYEARIDDGKLYYEKKWFTRGQPVFVETKDANRSGAVISAIGTQEIWLRKTTDNGKLRIYISQLQKGKYVLRRR